MHRRHFIAAAAGLALCAPGAGRAAARPIVAILRGGAWDPLRLRDDFVAGLRDEGFEEGRDYEIAYRSADGDTGREPALIAELVALNPAVIVTQTTGLTIGAHRATSTIPIVASTITDPVKFGVAQSIAHPGGNVTGLLSISASPAKVIELLLQVVPGIARVGMMINPSNPAHGSGMMAVKRELASLAVTFVDVGANLSAEIEPAFQALAAGGAQALFIGQDALFNQEMTRLAGLALEARLPTAYGFRNLPDAGGLMSYGGSLTARWRRAGVYAAKILHGEKPGDLPIEQQEKLELVINMKTAKALGLTIPPLVLTRADELIE